MRRKRRRTSLSYRLVRFISDHRPLPRRRRPRRRFRFVSRKRFIITQSVLAIVVIVALGLSASVIVRSIRTANTNRQLTSLLTFEEGTAPEAEAAAPALENSIPFINGAGTTAAAASADALKLSYMVLPDGSAITKAAVNATMPLRSTTGDILPNMQKLLETNRDTVGWLYIKGILSLPVVYRDNEYYLTHDFNGSHNTSGTLFLDKNHPITADAQNLLIYGHNMRDGSMFGLLTHYQRADYLKKHPFIRFSTLWEDEEYVIFAVVNASIDPQDERFISFYTHPSFSSDEEFEAYVRQLKAMSCRKTYINVKSGDALLTLCTCVGNDRLIVAARRIRPNESKATLQTLY